MREDIPADIDRGEAASLMEPMLVPEGSPHRARLNDLAIELASRSAGFRRSLPDGVRAALSELVTIDEGEAAVERALPDLRDALAVLGHDLNGNGGR